MKEEPVPATSVQPRSPKTEAEHNNPTQTVRRESRRPFISQISVTGAAGIAAGVVGFEPLLQTERSHVQAAQGSNQRANGILKDQRSCYNENFSGCSLTKFDGTVVTV